MCPVSKRCLIVVADDYGYSDRRDDGILECVQQGAVTHTSVMVTGVSVDIGVEKALKTGLSMGLHLNLTEGLPVGSSPYKTLVDQNGLLMDKFKLREEVGHNRVDMNEVMAEIQHQIDRFEQLTGSKPIIVDGHQHCHVIPGIADVFGRVLEVNKIAMTRLPVEQNIHTVLDSATFLAKMVQESRDAAAVFSSHGLWSAGFTGLLTMGANMTIDRLQKCILEAFNRLEADRQNIANEDSGSNDWQGKVICELMSHPGYVTGTAGGCGAGPDEFSQSPDREHEMSVIQHNDMRTFYQQNQIKLISFRDLL